jgi:hypothetical protein
MSDVNICSDYERRVIHISSPSSEMMKRFGKITDRYFSKFSHDKFENYYEASAGSWIYGFGTLEETSYFSKELDKEGIPHSLHPAKDRFNLLGKLDELNLEPIKSH